MNLKELLHEGMLDEAKILASEILERDPRHAEALAAMAKLALLSGDAALARVFLARAPAHPPSAEVTLVHAALAAECGDTGAALALYSEVLVLEERAEAWFGIGRVHAQRGALTECRAAFERAAELDPAGAAHHFYLGAVLAQLGERDRAVQCFRRTLERNAFYVPVYPALAQILLDLGHPREARELIEVGLGLVPEHPHLLAAARIARAAERRSTVLRAHLDPR